MAEGDLGVVVEAELTELDYLEAWRFSPTRRQTWLHWSILPCLSGASFLLGCLRVHDPAPASLIVRLMPSLLAFALLAQEIYEARSSWVHAVNRGVGFGFVTLRFDDAWLELESARIHYRVRWSDLTGRVETPGSVLIYASGGPWLLVPKWPWSAADLGALRAHVPGPPSVPRFESTRFFIGLMAVLLMCWCLRNA
jgi:hypothetical protein